MSSPPSRPAARPPTYYLMSQVLAPNPATPAPAAPTAERPAQKKCASCDTFRPSKDFHQGSKPASELKTCKHCRARVAERRRERKAEQRGELRDKAGDLAQALLFLADLHPEYRGELDRLATRLQKRTHRTADREAEAVASAIGRHGCHTVSDIVAQTRMLRSDVERVLSAMRASGRARSREITRGGGACELWSLVDAPAGSLVRP